MKFTTLKLSLFDLYSKIFKTKSVHEDEYKTSSRPNVSRPASKGASSDELLKQGFKVVKKVKNE